MRLRWAISWMRRRHMPLGRYSRQRRDVALRAVLLHGLAEGRVGPVVGLAVESENDALGCGGLVLGILEPLHGRAGSAGGQEEGRQGRGENEGR